VRHVQSNRSVGFGQIAAAAAAKSVPTDPRLKPESEWRLVGGGRSLQRRDIPAKVDGSAVFGIDVASYRPAVCCLAVHGVERLSQKRVGLRRQ
jgi:hypothetical protein